MRSIKLSALDYAHQVVAAVRGLTGKDYGLKPERLAKLGVKNIRLLSHIIYDTEDKIITLEKQRDAARVAKQKKTSGKELQLEGEKK